MKKVFFLFGFLLLANFVSAVPGIPHQFYGYVNFTNAPAPNGIVIEAKINGEVVASSITLNGRYGYKPKLFFVTDPNNNRAGKIITFSVNGMDVNATTIFKNGESTRMDFNIPGAVSELVVESDEILEDENAFISQESPLVIKAGEELTITVSSTDATTAVIEKVEKLESNFFSGVYAVPAGNNVLNAFEIKISGDVNVTVTMYYDDTGIDEATIAPYKFDGTKWVEIPYISKDTVANTITFSIAAETPYGIFGSPPAPTPTPTPGTPPAGGGGGGGHAYYCGDGKCSSKENYCSCPEDCEAPECGTCEEASCETGEPVCIAVSPCIGNGVCEEGENCENAPEDCACKEFEECIEGKCTEMLRCGDGICQENENCRSCREDCACPSGQACVNATCVTIPFCGDGTCNASESFESCPEDCKAPTPKETPLAKEEKKGALPAPAAPAGFFGLGLLGDIVGGILILIIIVGSAFYLRARKR